jgi:hypothetical protein
LDYEEAQLRLDARHCCFILTVVEDADVNILYNHCLYLLYGFIAVVSDVYVDSNLFSVMIELKLFYK